jgi:hypothetical protein
MTEQLKKGFPKREGASIQQLMDVRKRLNSRSEERGSKLYYAVCGEISAAKTSPKLVRFSQ